MAYRHGVLPGVGSQDGQTAVEYAGILLVVAAIVAALASAGVGRVFQGAAERAVCSALFLACGAQSRVPEPVAVPTPAPLPVPPVLPAPAPAPAPAAGSGVPAAERGVVGHVTGFVGGAAAGLGGLAQGLWETGAWGVRSVTSAEQRAQNGLVWDAVRADPLGAADAVWDGVTDPVVTEWRNGRPGAAFGRAGAEIAGLFGPNGVQHLRRLRHVGQAVGAVPKVAKPSLGTRLLHARQALAARRALGPVARSAGLRKIGDNLYESRAGLIYGHDDNFTNRVYHVLAHLRANTGKNKHTVFNRTDRDILGLLDEAWTRRSVSSPSLSNPRNEYYDVDFGRRVVGTKGETKVRVIVEKGTSNVATAYPVQ